VNVKINVWPISPEYEPIINADILISCPPSFSVSFSLPLHVDNVTQSTVEDCILECVIDDGKNAHRLLLRPMFDRWTSSEQPQPSTEYTITAKSYIESEDSTEGRRADFDLPTFGVAVLLATSITLTLIWLFSELFRLSKIKRRVRRDRGLSLANHKGSTAAPLSSPSSPPPPCAQQKRQFSDAVRRTLTSGRVIIRFIYAFSFTFTVFTAIVGVALRHRIDHSATPKSTPNSRLLAVDLEEDSAASIRLQIASYLAQSTFQLNGTGTTSSRRLAAIADVVGPSINSVQTAAVDWVEQTAERFLADVEVGLAKQSRYALTASLNHWLLFPRALYNRTAERGRHHTPPLVANSTSKDAFWNFLQVTPSEVELSLWTTNMRKR